MNMHDPNNNEETDDLSGWTAPASLIDALRTRKSPVSSRPIPPAVDRVILDRAHAILKEAHGSIRPSETERKVISFPGLWVRFAAAAAVVLLGLFIWFRMESPVATPQITLQNPTILDAFQLARRIESGTTVSPEFDLNHDGQVNETDATLLAQRAVTLPDGGAL